MLVLASSTQTLQVVLAGAKNTNDCPVTVMFIDEPTTQTGVGVPVKGLQQSTTNGVTAVTVCAAPGGGPGYRRAIKTLTLQNADLAAITVSIQVVDSSTSTTSVLQKYVLQTLENLCYTDDSGFQTFDANGALKSQAAATSSATSTAQAAGSQASSMASIALLGSSQASSLAAAIVPASVNSVSSQASSMAALVPASVSSAASLALIVSSNASLGSSVGWSTTLSKTKSSFGF